MFGQHQNKEIPELSNVQKAEILLPLQGFKVPRNLKRVEHRMIPEEVQEEKIQEAQEAITATNYITISIINTRRTSGIFFG